MKAFAGDSSGTTSGVSFISSLLTLIDGFFDDVGLSSPSSFSCFVLLNLIVVFLRVGSENFGFPELLKNDLSSTELSWPWSGTIRDAEAPYSDILLYRLFDFAVTTL